MRAEFSEFSYGFAITDEFINWRGTNLTAAPYFPSLTDEGNLGYDLRLDRPGIPLFIQFKRSEYISRVYITAQEFGVFYSPFFRMHIRDRVVSKQHELLCDLEANGNEIYYVAPLFISERKFNSFYIDRKICENSVFVTPLNIGRFTDYKKHHIAFQDTKKAYRFSSPVPLEKNLEIENITKSITHKLEVQTSQQNFGRDYWNRLSNNIERMSEDLKYFDLRESFIKEINERTNPLERIALLSQVVLGCQFFIANFKEDITIEIQAANRQNPFNPRTR